MNENSEMTGKDSSKRAPLRTISESKAIHLLSLTEISLDKNHRRA